MRRVHAFEFEDAPWFPGILRDGLTDVLRALAEETGAFAEVGPLLAELARQTGARRFVDLCSGSGGPILWLRERIEAREGLPLGVVLTDLYPNRDAFFEATRRAPHRIAACVEPVDAGNVPAALDGIRTLFNSLHHLHPQKAHQLLQDAATKRQPLAVFEVVDRSPGALAVVAVVPALALAFVPFVRRLGWRRLALTYAIPAIPAFLLWDGLASCLRAYSNRELEALAHAVTTPGYRFEIGSLPMAIGPARIRYLIGRPVEARA